MRGTRLRRRCDVGSDRFALLRIRNWRVRAKLVAVLAIPAVAFLAVGGLGVSGLVRDADTMDRFAEHVALGHQVTALVHELQRERDRTTGYLVAAGEAGADSAQATPIWADVAGEHRTVDAAAAEYHAVADPLHGRFDAPKRARFDAASRALAELDPLRAAVTARWIRQGAVFEQYTRIIAALLDLLPEEAAADETPLDQNVRALGDLARAKELTAQVRGHLYAVAHTGVFGFGEFQAFADLRAQRSAALNRFKLVAGERQLGRYERVVQGQATLAAERIEQSAVDRSQNPRLSIDPGQWWAASTTAIELVRTAESRFIGALVEKAQNLSADAWRGSVFTASGTLLILLNAVLISLVVSQSMARALRRLRRHALHVASDRLPAVIRLLRATPRGDPAIDVPSTDIDSADEVGEVAEAFDTVHREAVRLAVEQAVLRRNVSAMFVNLARRSQGVVERQIALIDELEERERSPDQLGHLFQLDHLATRMRRHNESLLVLAGGESRRRWTRPVSLRRVVLAAIGEIEQYPRVRHTVDSNIAVLGHVVTDVVHLLAELLENATMFSSPDTVVRVTGRMATENSMAVLSVEDQGLGMTASARADANRMLAEPPVLDVSVSHTMGLYVVSHLAARNQVRVALHESPAGGTMALVALPSRLLDPSGCADVSLTGAAGVPPEDAVSAPVSASAVLAPRRPSPSVGTGRRVCPPRTTPGQGGESSAPTPIWWAESGPPAPATPPSSRAAEGGATSRTGLPVREPMAALPRQALHRTPPGSSHTEGETQ